MDSRKAGKAIRGLTLIEMIVAVAIIGILAGIAWPLFEAQLQKSKRKEAINALLEASQQMHQCRTDQGNYAGCGFTRSSKDGAYTITATAVSAGAGFAITASHIAGTDAECTSLAIDHLGRKSHTGSATKTNTCWGE